MDQSMSFNGKFRLLMGVAVVGLLVLATYAVLQVRQEIFNGRRAELVSAVESQYNIVTGYQAVAAAGKMSVEDAKKAARDAVFHARYGGADGKYNYFYILTADGFPVMHPFNKAWQQTDKTLIGTINAMGLDVVKSYIEAIRGSPSGSVFTDSFVVKPGAAVDSQLFPKLQYLKLVPQWNWILGSGLYIDDAEIQARSALIKALLIVGLVLAVIVTLGVLIARSVLRQLGGDPRDAIAAMSQVASGDLTVNLNAALPGSLLASLARLMGSFRDTVTQVRRSAESIQVASSEVASGNQDLSNRTEQQASTLEQTASSMEQLSATVKQNADRAHQANQLASSASSVAVKGGNVVGEVVETMKGINEASRKISDIIGVIDGIAFQTNILALNAAVEAARAGEQGRGFAVVASEVRSLAGRSAAAAKEIKSLIGASVERVEQGTILVDQAGTTMAEVVASIRRVTDIMGEISAASSEQATGVAQVGEAVIKMDQATQQNAALVEEMAAAAGSLRSQAQDLVQVVAVFRLPEGEAPMPKRAPAATAQRPATVVLKKPALVKPAPAAGVKSAPRLSQAQAPKAATKPVTPAGGDDDWTSF